MDILRSSHRGPDVRKVERRKRAGGSPGLSAALPVGGGEGTGRVGEGRLRCCLVIPNNCGLILQVCIRKYKTRQFVGSSNFQSPESSKNYFSYPR